MIECSHNYPRTVSSLLSHESGRLGRPTSSIGSLCRNNSYDHVKCIPSIMSYGLTSLNPSTANIVALALIEEPDEMWPIGLEVFGLDIVPLEV